MFQSKYTYKYTHRTHTHTHTHTHRQSAEMSANTQLNKNTICIHPYIANVYINAIVFLFRTTHTRTEIHCSAYTIRCMHASECAYKRNGRSVYVFQCIHLCLCKNKMSDIIKDWGIQCWTNKEILDCSSTEFTMQKKKKHTQTDEKPKCIYDVCDVENKYILIFL